MSASEKITSGVPQILRDHVALDWAGEGAAALIFLHGGGAARQDWRLQLQHFVTRFRVLACDLPGHGESSTPATNEDATIDYLGAVTVELEKYLGCHHNVLVGHSMGCWVALEAYRQHPSAVTAWS